MEDTVFEGKWWRFDAYEIRDGYIRPAEGAALRTDEPLANFQVTRAERKEARGPETKPPYVSLINAIEKVEYGDNGLLVPSAEQSLLEWCQAHGLLGLLTHEVQQASFAPRWQPNMPSRHGAAPGLARQIAAAGGVFPKRSQGPSLYRTESVYQRTPYGSFRFGVIQDAKRRSPDADPVPAGQLLSEREWPRNTPSVVLYKLATREWACESVQSSWGRFFPCVADDEKATFEYPEPYTEEYWRMYGEPLHEFLGAARDFRDAFLVLGDVAETPEGAKQLGTTSALNSFVAPCGPTLLRTVDGLEQRMISPSLLGTLAVMAQQDLVAERRIFRCGNEKCRMLVVGHTYQSRFCSDQCRSAQNKREARRTEKRRKERRKHPNRRQGASKGSRR